jgi:aryl-alcohol dehydrogenase-like predicted oxidoreductase
MMQEVADKNGWTKFVSMQPEYSLIYREEVRASAQFFSHKLKVQQEREMVPYCQHNGIGIIPWSPLGGGMFGV